MMSDYKRKMKEALFARHREGPDDSGQKDRYGGVAISETHFAHIVYLELPKGITPESLLAERDALAAELRAFKLLITGGEDVAGQADTLTIDEAKGVLASREDALAARVEELEGALKGIALMGGNLSDDALMEPTGPNDAARLAELEAAAVWTEGPPPTEPQNKAWAVHRDGWKDCKIAKRSAGAWWIDGNRYGDHLQFDRHKPAPKADK